MDDVEAHDERMVRAWLGHVERAMNGLRQEFDYMEGRVCITVSEDEPAKFAAALRLGKQKEVTLTRSTRLARGPVKADGTRREIQILNVYPRFSQNSGPVNISAADAISLAEMQDDDERI